MIFTDQMNGRVELSATPKRIVSLVPSQTELLADLGLADNLVGITKFCVHPESVYQTVTRVGGTKDFSIEKILALKPDLVIGNKEENIKHLIEELAFSVPVWMSDIATLEDAYKMMYALGEITEKSEEAHRLVEDIQQAFSRLKDRTKTKRVGYFIWRKPYMVAGEDNIITHLMEQLGWVNIFQGIDSESGRRYPTVDENQIKSLAPELILLSSEPYPFGVKHLNEFKAMLPEANVLLVDGEMFSWYGSRLKYAPDYFFNLFSRLNV
jgi:ABC-type Fe3+-hydroxamate transport system substrate-binding protein